MRPNSLSEIGQIHPGRADFHPVTVEKSIQNIESSSEAKKELACPTNSTPPKHFNSINAYK